MSYYGSKEEIKEQMIDGILRAEDQPQFSAGFALDIIARGHKVGRLGWAGHPVGKQFLVLDQGDHASQPIVLVDIDRYDLQGLFPYTFPKEDLDAKDWVLVSL